MVTAAKNRHKVSVIRWQGSQHPTPSNITQKMRTEGLRPYEWDNIPNYRYAVRSHNYTKILYVIEGTLEITLPDSNQRVTLKKGDRINIPPGTRHGMILGHQGARCVEASIRR